MKNKWLQNVLLIAVFGIFLIPTIIPTPAKALCFWNCTPSAPTTGAPVTVQPANPNGMTGCFTNDETHTQVDPLATGACPSGSVMLVNGSQSSQASINMKYIPLEPLPNVPQDGSANFCVLLNGLFRLLIFLGGLIAVGSFVYAGILRMTSEVTKNKTRGREGMQASMAGLLLLISSYVILNTINPQLISCNNALNPVTDNSVVTLAGQTPQNQFIQDANACASTANGNGKLVLNPIVGGGYANCKNSSSLVNGQNCTDMPSGGLCITNQLTQENVNNAPSPAN